MKNLPQPPLGSTPDIFWLYRKIDSSGVSGTGYVAVGTIFPSGSVVLEWLGEKSSIEIHNSLENVEKIHGHNGNTTVVYICDLPDEE